MTELKPIKLKELLRTAKDPDVDDYAKFLPYARKQIRKWEAKDGKMIFYILPPRKKKARR